MAATTNLLQLSAFILFLSLPLFFAEEEEQVYILDSPYSSNTTTRSRFLVNAIVSIRKGAPCDAQFNNICNGASANNGTSILNCCKKHCRNVLGDRNNCGQCGLKCRLDQRCCAGICTHVLHNPSHCGKCNRRCSPGVRCEYGYCGYA